MEQGEIHGAQREGLPAGGGDAGHGGAQAGGVCAHEEAVYLQVSVCGGVGAGADWTGLCRATKNR